jgi:soluble lytic murein transglycosylase-like protein
MQVNWRYHQRRLQSFARALDPYPNIAVGAAILREHFDATGDWFKAVGRYHHPSNTARANAYARSVFARLPRIPCGRTHA